MVLYQQIIVALPKVPKEGLVALCRKHCKIILDNGGNVRGVENHGIRQLPERARRKYPASDGTRYFWEARYITTTFDASPKTLIDIDRLLKSDDAVLRHFTTKPKSAIDKARGSSYRNPYLSTTKLPTTQ